MICLIILFSLRSSLLIFVDEAVPQSSMPYFQAGLIIVLYKRSLFLMLSLLLLKSSQPIFRNLYDMSLTLVVMWSFHVSLLSKVSPKYLADSTCGMSEPFMDTGGEEPGLRVKVICVDFSAFMTMFHLASHGSTLFSISCSPCADPVIVSAANRKAVSSA